MEWTEESTINFINSYRNKKILWDTKNPKYYNKIKKNDAWEELAMEFHATVDECKKKMNVLLSALRREKAKIKKSRVMGTDVYESSWFAFKSLLFLWDKNKVRETQSTIKDEIEDDNEEKDTSGDEPTLTDNSKKIAANNNIKYEPQINLTEVPSNRKRQKKCEDYEKLDDALKSFSKAPATVSNSHVEKECETFGNFVATKLAKYSLELQGALQQEIMKVLCKADRIYLDQTLNNLQSLFPTSTPQHLQPERYQDKQGSNFTQQQSPLSPSASICVDSSRSTPANSSLPDQLAGMSDIKLEDL